jgi:hypothetical protein
MEAVRLRQIFGCQRVVYSRGRKFASHFAVLTSGSHIRTPRSSPGREQPGFLVRHVGGFIEAVSGGWPKVISNLKSLLETGSAVLQDPYPN